MKQAAAPARKKSKKGIAARQAVRSRQPGRAVAVHQPRPDDPPPSVLQIIARAAADPAVQPEKMRALLDMQKEIMAEEARRAFVVAFSALQEDLPIINAQGRIEIEAKKPGRKKQDTPYAKYNEIHRVTKPILRKHGFVLSVAPDEGHEGRLVMRGTLDHVGGHFKTGSMVLPLEISGSKNNVQGVGTSISYGRRYLAITLLNIVSEAIEDRDDDGQAAGSGDLIDDEQATEIVKLSAAATLKGETLLRRLNETRPTGHPEIKELADLPASRFAEAVERIRIFAAAKAAREANSKASGEAMGNGGQQ